MPAFTPRYGIPYPVFTDRVADGAAAIEATAEKVEEVMGNVADTTAQQVAAAIAQTINVPGNFRRLFLFGGA